MPASNGPITSVPQLLAPHDAAFIRTAYEAVLGRAPDPEGEAYYLARLRGGAHKLEILKQLRRSREGRNFIPGVAGLDRAIKRHHWATRPVIGAVVRLLTGAEGNSAIERQLRVIANDVGRLRAEMQRSFAQLGLNGTGATSPEPPVTNRSHVIRKRGAVMPTTEAALSQTEIFSRPKQSVPMTRRAQFIYAKLAETTPA